MTASATETWTAGDRRALGAVAAQFWINGMVYAAVVPRLPDIRDRLQIDVAALGLILTIAALGGLAGSAMGGPAIVRFGTRRCILGGTAATLAILPVIGLTRSAIVLTISLAALSLFDVVIDIGMNIQGSRLSARRSKPVMNRLHGLWSLGTVIGGLVAVRVTSAGVPIWQHLLAVAALLALTVGLSGRHLLADDEAPSKQGPRASVPEVGSRSGSGDGGGDGSGSGSGSGDGIGGDAVAAGRLLGEGLRYPLLLGLLGAAAVAMELTTSDWAAFRLADDLGVDPGRVGLGFVAFTSGMVTGRLAGDTIQNLVGAEALVRYATSLAAFGLLLATLVPDRLFSLSVFADGWLSSVTPTAVSLVGFYLAALGVSVIFPQLYDRAAKAPGPAGRGLAGLTAGTRVAGLVAPVIVGALAGSSLSVGAAVAAVTLPACAITLLVPEMMSRLNVGRDQGERERH